MLYKEGRSPHFKRSVDISLVSAEFLTVRHERFMDYSSFEQDLPKRPVEGISGR